VQGANDKQRLETMPNGLLRFPDVLSKAETILADNGYH
jgi:hypothetical protein